MNYSCELMNICMIIDAKRNMVLVQNRSKESWKGIAFPGGHVDPGEGFGESIVREVREENRSGSVKSQAARHRALGASGNA